MLFLHAVTAAVRYAVTASRRHGGMATVLAHWRYAVTAAWRHGDW